MAPQHTLPLRVEKFCSQCCAKHAYPLPPPLRKHPFSDIWTKHPPIGDCALGLLAQEGGGAGVMPPFHCPRMDEACVALMFWSSQEFVGKTGVHPAVAGAQPLLAAHAASQGSLNIAPLITEHRCRGVRF